jgi:uncharacterized C2H2 Zn-finger protein
MKFKNIYYWFKKLLTGEKYLPCPRCGKQLFEFIDAKDFSLITICNKHYYKHHKLEYEEIYIDNYKIMNLYNENITFIFKNKKILTELPFAINPSVTQEQLQKYLLLS